MKTGWTVPKSGRYKIRTHTSIYFAPIAWPMYPGGGSREYCAVISVEKTQFSLELKLIINGQCIDVWRYPPNHPWIPKLLEMTRAVLWGRYDATWVCISQLHRLE